MIKFLVQDGIGACASRKRKQQIADQLSAARFQCDFPVRPSICDDLEYDAHLREVVSRVDVE